MGYIAISKAVSVLIELLQYKLEFISPFSF